MSEITPAPSERPAASLVVRGARTHNLKNVDLTLPHRRLIVFTGVSGSGKSSLAFDTIYAEGQRRYVESLSAYARQFLERMEKPDVDGIDGIAPAIAIRQKNSIRNPRSTVGTTTEIHDYLRLLWARVGRTMCRQCGKWVERESPEVVATELLELPVGTRLLVGFDVASVNVSMAPVAVEQVDGDADTDQDVRDAAADQLPFDDTRGKSPATPSPASASEDPLVTTLATLRRRGFGRLLVGGRAMTIDEASANLETLRGSPTLAVIVDRLKIDAEARTRLTDSIETAFHEGDGAAFAIEVDDAGVPRHTHRFSERFECRTCGIVYKVPQPRLFSFNNPFGACPTCHGFGNIIELDMDLVVPDRAKSINAGAIEPWSKPHYRSCLVQLKRTAKTVGLRLDVPWQDLTDDERRMVIDGHDEYDGINGFFRRLERKKYKVHVRVFLSRYRGYLTCHDCGGTRLRREARDVRVGGKTIDAVCALTVKDATTFFADLALSDKDAAVADKVLREVRRRLGFLTDVGLDYLTLDRLSATLSGGESQRINLATSLGSALVDTLYVLDEPSIGLHPRDNERLIAILKQLRDQGNTVIVVEHDADMIRVADWVVDLGLGAGEQGGRVIFSGEYAGLLADTRSLTARYLRDELAIPVPETRRRPGIQRLLVRGASEHNLKNVDVEIPLGILTAVVSAGIIWINAAGNYGGSVYNGPITLPRDGYVQLGPNPSDTALHLRSLLDENVVTITLTWNDYGNVEDAGTDKDLDLFIEDDQGHVVGSSELKQIKADRPAAEGESQNPRERVVLTDLPAAPGHDYRIRVKARSNNFSRKDHLRILVTAVRDAPFRDPQTGKSTRPVQLLEASECGEIYPPADHPGVITVGDASRYSSIGPTADRRSKPDVVLEDATAQFSNGEETKGSSNAAAYFTGVVALMKAAQPGLQARHVLALARQRETREASVLATPSLPLPSLSVAERFNDVPLTDSQQRALRHAERADRESRARGERNRVWISLRSGGVPIYQGPLTALQQPRALGSWQTEGSRAPATQPVIPRQPPPRIPWRTPSPERVAEMVRALR